MLEPVPLDSSGGLHPKVREGISGNQAVLFHTAGLAICSPNPLVASRAVAFAADHLRVFAPTGSFLIRKYYSVLLTWAFVLLFALGLILNQHAPSANRARSCIFIFVLPSVDYADRDLSRSFRHRCPSNSNIENNHGRD